MASNNPLFNQFNQQGRETPNPLQVNQTVLPVPTNVPFIQPVDVTPPNLAQAAKLSQLNQLADALGRSGFGSGAMAESIMKAVEKRKALHNEQAYAEGLRDMTLRAGKTRDLYSDLSKNGWMYKSDNPYYQQAAQTFAAAELTAQYRFDLNQARRENPLADPLELQDQVKQKYMGLFGQMRPDVAYKFFIEPSKKIDEDDYGAFKTKQDEEFVGNIQRKVGGAIDATIQEEVARISTGGIGPDGRIDPEGGGSLEELQRNTAKQFQGQLEVAIANGLPYKPVAEAMFDVVLSNAEAGKTITEKLGILASIERVTGPEGQRLLSDPSLARKYRKAVDDVKQGHHQQEKLERENYQLLIQESSSNRVNQMLEDSQEGGKGLQPLETYLKFDPENPIDPEKVITAYKSFDSGVTSYSEQKENAATTQLSSMIAEGASPAVVQEVALSYEKAGLIPPGSAVTWGNKAFASQQDRKQATTPKKFNPALVNNYISTVAVGQDLKFGNNTLISVGPVSDKGRQIDEDIKAKAKRLFTRKMNEFMEQNPQASDTQQTAAADDIWSSEINPMIQRDKQKLLGVTNRSEYDNIIYGGGAKPAGSKAPITPSKPITPATNKPTPKPAGTYTKQGHAQTYFWAYDPQQSQQAVADWRMRKGPLYNFFVTKLRQDGKLHNLNVLYLKQNPQVLLDSLKKKRGTTNGQ